MTLSIREIGENIKNSPFFKGSLSFEEGLSERTTMKVGGRASLFVEPEDSASLAFALKTLWANGTRLFVLGGGSNVVVSDSGFDGAVVSTRRLEGVSASYTDGATSYADRAPSSADRAASYADGATSSADRAASYADGATSSAKGAPVLLTAGAGTLTDAVVLYAAEHALTGIECFASLPGTVGGAAYMNARCYEKSLSDVISSVTYLDASDGFAEKTLTVRESDWSYKHSPFTGTKNIVTSVTFALSLSDSSPKTLLEKCSFYEEDRRKKGHFKFPSAGSVFKNNRNFGKPTGALIDECGLKGTLRGGAQIAPWHGNFIINRGSASAQDIKELVTLAQTAVRECTGFNIEPEIIFV